MISPFAGSRVGTLASSVREKAPKGPPIGRGGAWRAIHEVDLSDKRLLVPHTIKQKIRFVGKVV